MWRKSALGNAMLFTAFLGYAIPNFVLAILMLLLFSFTLNWLPSAGSATLAHYVMPTLALSAYFVAALVRYTRNAMLDVLVAGLYAHRAGQGPRRARRHLQARRCATR